MNRIKKIFVAFTVTVCFLSINTVMAQNNSQTNDQLTQKEQSIVSVAAFTAKIDMSMLRIALNQSLDAELTINELKEVMVQLYPYAGFPRSLNGLSALQTVAEERKAKGISDKLGKEAKTLPNNADRLKIGTDIQTKLLGRPMKTSVADFSPIIDIFLKEHLFADIFSRNILDFRTREIITISTLASLGNVENQLQGHINVGIYNGVTQPQLNQIADILKTKIGASESNLIKEILNKINQQNTQKMENQAISKAAQNPWTLVYDGAITENVLGKVNIHPVTYKIKDIDIVANVYIPANYDASKKYSAVVVAHPNGGVKEQVAGLYAQRLAELGYITITADAAYQGGSGGTPRNTDKPANRIEDIYAMCDFIAQYAGVDKERIGLLGICGGGGYSLKAAQSYKLFKAVLL